MSERRSRTSPLRLLLALPLIAIALSVLGGSHWYVAERLVWGPRWPAPFGQLAIALLAILLLSLIAQPIGERLLPRRLSRLVAFPASLWMGFGFLLLTTLAASDLLLGVMGMSSGADVDAVGVARPRAALVAVVALGVAGYAVRGALAGPVVRHLDVAIERWPGAAEGFRIVQISDIHIGSILGREFAETLVERVNALEPDLIAVTGDLVDGAVERLREETAPFAGLSAPHGVFFVTGNHDHYSGASGWVEEVKRLGMRVLRNERVTIETPGGDFVLAGVDDHHASMLPGEHGEDLERALDGAEPEQPVVLLAHDPSTFKKAAAMGVDLQLSGHTHGGQIWPFRYLVRLSTPFVAGHYRRGRSQLYVSRGTGFWGPPMRLAAPAEITLIRLAAVPRSTPSAAASGAERSATPASA